MSRHALHGKIAGITIVARDVERSARDAFAHFGYEIVDESHVSSELAGHWCAERLAGARTISLVPKAGDPVPLRFVEDPEAVPPPSLARQGWSAIEIAVANCDDLHSRLADSRLEILGEPANSSLSDDVRAMQTRGRDGEVYYLTQVKAEIPGFVLPRATTDVEHTFIAVNMCTQLDTSASFYENLLGARASDAFATRVGVINRAHGLDDDHNTEMRTMQLGGASVFELDQAPRTAAPLNAPPQRLASGFAMVSIAVDTLGSDVLRLATAQDAIETPFGPSCGVIHGPDGEALELIALPPAS